MAELWDTVSDTGFLKRKYSFWEGELSMVVPRLPGSVPQHGQPKILQTCDSLK